MAPADCNLHQGSERGANHQGMAHPDTPQTPHKRAPFGGVPRGGQKRGPKKVSKKVSRMGELLNTPFFVHFFAPRGPIFGPPWGDPPKNPHFCCYRYGFGPRKGGFWGVPGSPPAAPGRPGPRPRNFPPGPRARPRAPPRDPPSGTPPGTPPMGPPRRVPPDPEIWPATVVPMTWRSVGARTPCSSSRSPCGVSAARWSATGHGDRSDLALRARPQDRHVGGRAARVVVGSDASMPPDTCNLAPVCPGLRPLRSGSSLRVPASSLPAASRFILSPGGSADWVAESGALHYRALLSAQTVVGEPPHPPRVPAGGPADPLPRPCSKKCLPAGPAGPPKWAPRTPIWGPRGAPKGGSGGPKIGVFGGPRGVLGGPPGTPRKCRKNGTFLGPAVRERGGVGGLRPLR